MIEEIGLITILSLFLVAMFAGFFDAIAGGGGLVTLPALFISGIDPVAAIATNKFQAAAATVSATTTFARKRMINWRLGVPMAMMAGIGSLGGSALISILPRAVFNSIVPILLVVIGLYFLFTPTISEDNRVAKISTIVFSVTIAPLLGFYDGAFGPGVGSFIMLSVVSLLGFGIVKGMAHTKLINATSNICALIIFALHDEILWPIALTMAIGAFTGAQLGSICAVKIGGKLIRPMIVIISFLMGLHLFFKN